MQVVSVALPSSFSAPLSLLGLDTSGPITFGLSAGQSASDTYSLYGTLDSAATNAGNAQLLGQFNGASPWDVLQGFVSQAATWPYLLVRRTGGSTSGTFYACGNAVTAASVVSAAAPSAGLYSSVLDLTAFTANGVRIGGSAAMTSGDVFLVYGALSNSVTSSDGGQLLARITGGGGTNAISCFAKGFPYAIVRRVSGTTSGTVIAAGAPAPTSGPGATAWVQGGNAFGATGVLGTTDAQSMNIEQAGSTFISDDGLTTTLGRAAGASDSVVQGAIVTIAGDSVLTAGAGSTTSFTDNGFNVSVGHAGPTSTLTLTGNSAWLGQATNGSCSLSASAGVSISAGGAVQTQGSRIEVPATTIADGTGSIGTAAATVDAYSLLLVNQTTTIKTYAAMRTIPNPTTSATKGRRVTVMNIGTAPFLLGATDATAGKQGVNMVPGMTSQWYWTGTIWSPVIANPGVPVIADFLSDGNATVSRIGCYTRYNMPSITADRTLTFDLTGARWGDLILVSRTSTDAHTLTLRDNGGSIIVVLPSGQQGGAIIGYFGTDWLYLLAATL